MESHDNLEEQQKEWFTLAQAIKQFPELMNNPFIKEYGFSAENIFEQIAGAFRKDDFYYKAVRNNREDKYSVDFKIIDTVRNKDICYCDIEGDNTGAFLDNGTFKYWQINVPFEKKKYFYQSEPFFYIKYSSNFQWCYVIDGFAVRKYFIEKIIGCQMDKNKENKINRLMLVLNSNQVFCNGNKFGVHRCKIQDWFRMVIFFMKLRYMNDERWFKYAKKN